MRLSACPRADELSQFNSGLTSEADADAISRHLDECDACAQRISDLSSEVARFLNQATQQAGEFEFQHEDGWRFSAQSTPRGTPQDSHGNPADALPVGAKIGPYVIAGCIGVGGMGYVYRAFHNKLKRDVALKLLPQSQSSNTEFVSRFEREMAAVGSFRHSNIVTAYDAGEHQGTSFLAMELVEGPNLAEVQHALKRFALADACEVIRQVAVGLDYVHQRGTLHRDIKPSNLMLTQDERDEAVVKILDLGLARISGNHQQLDRHSEFTVAGQIVGTLEFMSPEQADGKSAIDVRSDIYSLGATLYKLLTGAPPYSTQDYDTPVRMLSAIANQSPTPISKLLDVPEPLADLIARMIARDVQQRPATASQVAEEIRPFVEGADLLNLLKLAPSTLRPALEVATLSAAHDVSVVSARPAPNGDSAVAASRMDEEEQAPPTNPKATRRRPGISVAVLSTAFLSLAILAAAAIWLKTDGGYLKIESPAGIDVAVEVLKDGQVVDTVEVGKGPESIWYRAGTYEIRLPAADSRRLQLSQNIFTLKYRGKESVIISQLTNADVADLKADPETVASLPPVQPEPLKPLPPKDPDPAPPIPPQPGKIVRVPLAENEDLKFLRWYWSVGRGGVWVKTPEDKDPKLYGVLHEMPSFEIEVEAERAETLPPRYVEFKSITFGRQIQLTNEFVRKLPIEDLENLETVKFDAQHLLTPLAYEYLHAKQPNLRGLSDLPRLTDELIPVLYKFEHLEEFWFHGEDEGDKWAEGLSKIKTLKKIHAYGSAISAEGLEHLTSLPNLTTLELDREVYRESWLAPLLRMKSLTHLTLPNNGDFSHMKTQQYNKETVLRFAALTNLTHLDLGGNAPREAVVELQLKLPACEIKYFDHDEPVVLAPISSR